MFDPYHSIFALPLFASCRSALLASPRLAASSACNICTAFCLFYSILQLPCLSFLVSCRSISVQFTLTLPRSRIQLLSFILTLIHSFIHSFSHLLTFISILILFLPSIQCLFVFSFSFFSSLSFASESPHPVTAANSSTQLLIKPQYITITIIQCAVPTAVILCLACSSTASFIVAPLSLVLFPRLAVRCHS